MRGKKGERHGDPRDPPRHRANKRKGHGTYDNDRPPVVGTVGRRTGRCRLRVREHTDSVTLCRHIHTFTQRAAHCHTDEWPAYHQIQRRHVTVSHGDKEWARDDDRDGIREVHVNTIEGLWTTVRNFLRSFRGVHKKYLQDYLAMCEHRINRKRISPAFIAGLVAVHKTCT
jgi:transposase-like protein